MPEDGVMGADQIEQADAVREGITSQLVGLVPVLLVAVPKKGKKCRRVIACKTLDRGVHQARPAVGGLRMRSPPVTSSRVASPSSRSRAVRSEPSFIPSCTMAQ